MQLNELPDVEVGPTPVADTRRKHRAQYIIFSSDGKPHHMGSSYDPSREAVRLEKAGERIEWLNGYRGNPTHELALSTPNVLVDVAGSSFSSQEATSDHPFPTWSSTHDLQSCPQDDHHRNHQHRSWQPYQSPPTTVVGSPAPLDHASCPTQVTTEKPARRGGGRPPGSKNKPKNATPEAPKEKRKRGRPPGSKNKPKVTATSRCQESSPNLQYQNNGRAKRDNIGQERREYKIAVRDKAGANLFSQNQLVVHQNFQTEQPFSAGRAYQAYDGYILPAHDKHFHAQQPLYTNILTSYTHPSTVAQNNFSGQNRTHPALPTYNVYGANWEHDEHLSSSQGHHSDTPQPLNTNSDTLAGHAYPFSIVQDDLFGQIVT